MRAPSQVLDPVLSANAAEKLYDRLGAHHDVPVRNAAIERMIATGDFESASRVLELGCGTGRLAERLLRERLRPDASYVAIDLSSTMVALTRERFTAFPGRTEALRADISAPLPADSAGFDRVVATYVLDLLAPDAIDAVLAEVLRVLRPGGLFCSVELTFGTGLPGRAVCRVWQRLFAWEPRLLGGCRPIRCAEFIGNASGLEIVTQERVQAWGVCSEVTIARRAAGPAS